MGVSLFRNCSVPWNLTFLHCRKDYSMQQNVLSMVKMVTQHIPTMTKFHHGGEESVMMKVGMCQSQKPTIHHDELYFGVYMYIR